MNEQTRCWVSGQLILDEVLEKATIKHQEVPLSSLSFKVMLALVKAHPQAVDHQTLIDRVWGDVAVSPETVTQRMALIRKALTAAGLDPGQYLVSARHVGYRWRMPVQAQQARRPWGLWYWVTGGLLLVTLLVLGFILINPTSDTSNQATATSTTEPATSQISADELARQAWQYLDQHTAQSSHLAIGLFRQALQKDENHVNALTGLSIALSHQVTKFNQADHWLTEAKTLAQRATQLQPDLAQAWSALAFSDDARGDIDQAIIGYEKAIELDPNNSSTISSVAYLYGKKGRLADALERCVAVLHTDQLYLNLQVAQLLELLGFTVLAEQWYLKADVLSPDNVFATHQRARFYLAQNQSEQAIEVIEQAINRGVKRPELPVLLGLQAWQTGDLPRAADLFQSALTMDPEHSQAQWLVWALQAPQERDEATIAQALQIEQQWPDQWVYQAQFLAHTGAYELAFERMQLAFAAGYRHVAWVQWLPTLAPLRSDPQWSTLMAAMQQAVGQQRDAVLRAPWLPPSFLDPQHPD